MKPLPHSVVFALRKDKSISALPVTIPHRKRALGFLKRGDAGALASRDHFAHDMRAGFESLEDPIKPHEQSVVWGN
jgi:hypothetical protein